MAKISKLLKGNASAALVGMSDKAVASASYRQAEEAFLFVSKRANDAAGAATLAGRLAARFPLAPLFQKA